jgi:carbonic anhydrase
MQFYLLLVVFIIYNFFNLSLSADPHWDYGALGPDVWKDTFPTCGGSSQSPINIKTSCTTYQSFEPFQFSSAYGEAQDFVLTNNGHTIVGQQVNASAYPLTLSGGGLTEPFTFVNFHLHWGENYNSGSEHQM